jgi:hypothetical protein
MESNQINYIVTQRFKGQAVCGDVNLPALTGIFLRGNILYFGEKPLCVVTSENAHRFFARNDDGQGMERGRLTRAIMETLAKKDKKHQERWDRIWEDDICQKFKRPLHNDRWLWNTAFYNAEIRELEHILNLIKEVE